jgi:hypothetical protein
MTEVRAASLARPFWRRARLWIGLAALVVVGAFVVTAVGSTPDGPLDPTSPNHGGSKALAVLLDDRGTSVRSLTAVSAALDAPASTTVLIAFPDDLSSAQLRRLANSGHRLVVLEPDPSSLGAVAPGRHETDGTATTAIAPDCNWAGAQAAGAITFSSSAATYSGDSGCYGGALIITDRLVLVGSADLLRNDQLASGNNAALDMNAISADGSISDVDWLLPGADDSGTGSPSVWVLFPSWTQRAFWWLLVVGVLAALWRGRRLGPVVEEPLPVIVRSAEIVEGHGRLYERAAARERAAALLRSATRTRLALGLGLDRRATPAEIAAVATTGAPDAAALVELLTGEPPVDDGSLVRLAGELAALESDLRTRSVLAVPKGSDQ